MEEKREEKILSTALSSASRSHSGLPCTITEPLSALPFYLPARRRFPAAR